MEDKSREKETSAREYQDHILYREKAEARMMHLNSVLRAVSKISQLIIKEKDKKTLFTETCRILVESRNYRLAWIGLIEEGTFEVKPAAHAGAEDGYLRDVHTAWDDSPNGRGPTGTTIKTNKPSIVNDIASDPIFANWRDEAQKRGYRSMVSARSACMYEGALKELIHKFKYNNRRMLSGTFAGIMLDFIKDNPDTVEGIDVITFVPLHRKRALTRGFNQSKLLASLIGKALDIPVTGCLEKTRLTKNQNELSRENRLVNLKGAFRIRPDIEEAAVRGAGILLIDDVMTTGTTLNEISRMLMDRGAGKVRCLTLARGV